MLIVVIQIDGLRDHILFGVRHGHAIQLTKILNGHTKGCTH